MSAKRLDLPKGRGEPMPKKKEPELTPEEQSKRFKEAADKAGVTQNEKVFEMAFGKIARVKLPRSTSKKS